ncbi:TatD family hydrolase [Methylobacterium sp. E-041]|uniref:TatD family hydrolase n=1 Tax=Methylobacterium sp. E-041 TaxID=2836573 RepID=UPI001FBBFC81|nr:TatD family hydrolase [Methylobacterium sp. E-041]MCJ2103907.1 TatD family hydrolase [Methylobacterium sp. E-041]
MNAEMLRSPKHRKLVGELPADRLLTETDGPFVERHGQPARPRDVAKTVAELANLRSESADQTAQKVLSNLRSLLGDQPVDHPFSGPVRR